MLIQDRVKLIIKANSLSSSEFADKIGIKRSNLSHVLNGRNKPGLDFLSKVITAFPNVNASWLLTGQQREGLLQEENTSTSSASKGEKQVSENKEIKANKPRQESGIDRIVVFYTNGQFKEYQPSEE